MTRWAKALMAGILGSALLTAGTFVLVPRTLRASEPAAQSTRTISVTGRATVDARPDAARITFGVNQLETTADAAYNSMAEVAGGILAAMKQIGVDDKDVRTSGLSLQAEYDYDREGQQHLRGYRASNTVTVTTRNMDKIGALIDAAVKAGANSVSGVEFYVWDTAEYSRAALDGAVDDARSKAEQVAKRLGANLDKVTRVQIADDGGSTSPPVYYAAEAKAASFDRVQVMAGTSRFQVTVSVEFSLH